MIEYIGLMGEGMRKYVTVFIILPLFCGPTYGQQISGQKNTIPKLLSNYLTKSFSSVDSDWRELNYVTATIVTNTNQQINIDHDSTDCVEILKGYPNLCVRPLKMKQNIYELDVMKWKNLPFVTFSFCHLNLQNSEDTREMQCRNMGNGKLYSIYSITQIERNFSGETQKLVHALNASALQSDGNGWNKSNVIIRDSGKNLQTFVITLTSVLENYFEQHDEICKNCMIYEDDAN